MRPEEMVECLQCKSRFSNANPPKCKLPIEAVLKNGNTLFLPSPEMVGCLCSKCFDDLLKVLEEHVPHAEVIQRESDI